MKDGFIRVCAATPDIRVADCQYNEKNIMKLMDEAYAKQISVLVFPELCITGYTCGDLFLQDVLLKNNKSVTSHSRFVFCFRIRFRLDFSFDMSCSFIAPFCRLQGVRRCISFPILYRSFHVAKKWSVWV